MSEFTPEQLAEILRKHDTWRNGEVGGERADLRCADLRCADLRGADLSLADLRCADLRGADLSYADLRYAGLSNADLRNAGLSNADLRNADLSNAAGDFSVFYGGKHHAWAAGGQAGIGCHLHPIEYWQEHYREIGAGNKYTPEQIERYGAWIMSLDWLKLPKDGEA